MTRLSRRPPAVTALVFCGAFGAVAVSAEPEGLSTEDRAYIEEFLGPDFLGEPVEAPPIADTREFLNLGEGASWQFVGVHGKHDGQRQALNFALVGEKNGGPLWQLDFEGTDGREIQTDNNGSLMSVRVEDTDEGVVIDTEPPDPLLIEGMRAGDEVAYRIDIRMFDKGNEQTTKYEGYLDMTYRYVGAFRVTVPAGTFDASAFRWHFKGKVGPANIEDVQFAFIAKGVGPIAYIERKDISAFVIYQKTNRDARVLATR